MNNAGESKDWREGGDSDDNGKSGHSDSGDNCSRKNINDDGIGLEGGGQGQGSDENNWRCGSGGVIGRGDQDCVESDWRTARPEDKNDQNEPSFTINFRRQGRGRGNESVETNWRRGDRKSSRDQGQDTRPSQRQESNRNNFGGRRFGGTSSSVRGSRFQLLKQGHGNGERRQGQISTLTLTKAHKENPDTGSMEELPYQSQRKQERRLQSVDFDSQKMLNYLQMDPHDVILSINSDKDGWKDFLESQACSGETLILAIHVIGEKICNEDVSLHHLKTAALIALCSSNVTNKMEAIISKIGCTVSTKPVSSLHANSEIKVDASPERIFKNLYQLCLFIMKTMPNNGIDYFQGLITKSVGALAISDPSSELFNDFKTLLDQICLLMKQKENMKEKRKQRTFNNQDFVDFDSETPPDNIEDISTVPTVEDLSQTYESFLRPNKPTGAYKNCDHYLDVQFRLFREDFVKPLREGVQTFLRNKLDYFTGRKRLSMGEGHLYTNVKILGLKWERDTLVYKLVISEVDCKKFNWDWDTSKRLLPGSLVVLTTVTKCFEEGHTHFGTIYNRDNLLKRSDVVSVTWEGPPPKYDENKAYLMFEPEVYFEAYKHTLNTLKKLDLDTFPMKKFIVEASQEVKEPQYFHRLSNLESNLLKLKKANGSYVEVSHCDEAVWPTAEEFRLDENQFQAFRAALTKQLSIIQGPPGTGKTFLGLKVAESLLENSHLWKRTFDGPIIVVCYTNHALDQFLEGIYEYFKRHEKPRKIVRIGGRCQSEVLQDFTLGAIKHQHRKSRRRTEIYDEFEGHARWEVYKLKSERSTKMADMVGLQHLQGLHSIIDFETLNVWNELQHEYPKILWQHLRNWDWYGIGNKKRMAKELFNVHESPSRKVEKEEVDVSFGLKRATVFKVPVKKKKRYWLYAYDEYDYDPFSDSDSEDDRPIIDSKYFIESETSFVEWESFDHKLRYYSKLSVNECDSPFETLQRSRSYYFWKSKASSLNMIGENQNNLLEEIFRLYNQHILDLPDVTDLLDELSKSKESKDEEESVFDFNKLKIDQRWTLYFAMVERAKILTMTRLTELEKDLRNAQERLNEIIALQDALLVRTCADIVGFTTTGAAKYNNLLKSLRSKIVIIEEAAEVFEAHIVTCISESCEQMIMIGDHRQLRPNPAVYELGKKYNLDLSFFERMLNNKIPCYQLKSQRRMRPEISDLVVGTIYEELYDHDSVKLYHNVMGITKNVFFITHAEKEKSDKESCSKSNEHEVNFIAALARHLILQRYSPERVTILTMYKGQMAALERKVNGNGDTGIRITCVDNFQGEENDIILLSLVRSNDEGKIGFLNIDNRICVAVSRAKLGLYIIGNMGLIESKSKTWEAIKQKLEKHNQIGDALELECQMHKTRAKVQFGDDFMKVSPEGGCMAMCDTILPCSHKCPKACHIIDKDHARYMCEVRCEKTLPCEYQHKRRLPCYRKVEETKCEELVEKKLPCGHIETFACHIKKEDYKCTMRLQKKLTCGHEKLLECHKDPLSVKCKTMVPKDLACDHTQNDECWKKPEEVICDTLVGKKFPKCGHEVQVKCHLKELETCCIAKCTTPLTCGHPCVKPCHVENDPDHLLYECRKPCSKECANHHKCKIYHQCHQQCPPCKQLIKYILPCGHAKELWCFINAEKCQCSEDCKRLIGHTCPNLCPEICGSLPVPEMPDENLN